MLQKKFIRNDPISRVSVDNEGIISTQIPVAYGGEELDNLRVSISSSYENIHKKDNS